MIRNANLALAKVLLWATFKAQGPISNNNTDSTCITRTGVGSRGYAWDLTTPTIYVEGILICISPLENPNT